MYRTPSRRNVSRGSSWTRTRQVHRKTRMKAAAAHAIAWDRLELFRMVVTGYRNRVCLIQRHTNNNSPINSNIMPLSHNSTGPSAARFGKSQPLAIESQYSTVRTVPAHRYGPNGTRGSRVTTYCTNTIAIAAIGAKKNAANDACHPITPPIIAIN